MCARYSCIFNIILTQFAPKTLLKHLIVHFLTLDLSKQNGVGCVLSNVITSSQPVITVRNVFANKNIGEMISLVRNAFRIKHHADNAGLILSIYKFRPMFKQHVNLLTMGVNSYTYRHLCKNKSFDTTCILCKINLVIVFIGEPIHVSRTRNHNASLDLRKT